MRSWACSSEWASPSPQSATGSVLLLEPDCQGAGGEGKQEEWACAPAPHLMAGHLLRSEGTAPSASRTGHRNWTQRKLNPNPSFTISSGTLSKPVTLRVISFSSGKYKVENDPSLQNELLWKPEEIMDFKWLGNHKVHHKSHNSNLPPSVSFLRWRLASGLLRWPRWKWCKVANKRSLAWGSHGGLSERPSHLVALGKLILLLPQAGPWEVSGQVNSWLIGRIL